MTKKPPERPDTPPPNSMKAAAPEAPKVQEEGPNFCAVPPKKRATHLTHFSDRVLTITLPTAGMLGILVFTKELDPSVAVLSFATVVLLTVVVMLPFMDNLRTVADYTRQLSLYQTEDDLPEAPKVNENEESGEIISAINQMQSFWSARHAALKAQTLSDTAVLDSLPDPLLMLGRESRIMGANQAARALFGSGTKDRPLSGIIPDVDVLEAVDSVLSGEMISSQLEWRRGKSGDASRIFQIRMEPLPIADDEAHQGAVAVLALHDISALKKIEQLQADFVANASHELRTPLSIISGFVETLLTSAKDDEEAREKFLGIMQAQTSRMSQLVEDLLSLSKIQLQDDTAPKQLVNVDMLLDKVTNDLHSKAEQAEAKIEVEKEAPLPPVIGYENELIQVLHNLTDNALKYGEEKGTVTISAAPAPEMTGAMMKMGGGTDAFLRVSVHNMGAPIPKKDIPRLTERFYRTADAGKNKATGSGLGLAIVKHILNRHKGTLHIESSEHEGTTFTAYLPLAPGALAEARTDRWGDNGDADASANSAGL